MGSHEYAGIRATVQLPALPLAPADRYIPMYPHHFLQSHSYNQFIRSPELTALWPALNVAHGWVMAHGDYIPRNFSGATPIALASNLLNYGMGSCLEQVALWLREGLFKMCYAAMYYSTSFKGKPCFCWPQIWVRRQYQSQHTNFCCHKGLTRNI